MNSPSVVLQSSYWGAALFLAFAAWRLVRPMWGRRTRESAGTPQGSSPSTTGLSQHLSDAFAQRIWAPHAATTVIGITFAFMLLSAGVWAYTDVLALLARGMTDNLLLGTLLLATLLLGALLGGFTAGRWSPAAPRVRDVLRSLAGSALMGWGSLLIPGSNDGLILVGMPMLWSYAWVAFGTMCVTIAVAQCTSTALALWLGAPTAQ